MPAFLLPMDILIAPMILLAGTAAADLPAGGSAGPRAGARATVSARIIRGESVAFESSESISRAVRTRRDDRSLVLPKARDRKTKKARLQSQQILVEFY
ncbi:MAG: hypothetical protein AAGM33_03855 [Pseudomonadota bacterium]